MFLRNGEQAGKQLFHTIPDANTAESARLASRVGSSAWLETRFLDTPFAIPPVFIIYVLMYFNAPLALSRQPWRRALAGRGRRRSIVAVVILDAPPLR